MANRRREADIEMAVSSTNTHSATDTSNSHLTRDSNTPSGDIIINVMEKDELLDADGNRIDTSDSETEEQKKDQQCSRLVPLTV
jgi:hypothetical protein